MRYLVIIRGYPMSMFASLWYAIKSTNSPIIPMTLKCHILIPATIISMKYTYYIYERCSTINRHNICWLCLTSNRYCHHGIPTKTIVVEWPSWHHYTYIVKKMFKESISILRSVFWTEHNINAIDERTLDVWLQFHMQLERFPIRLCYIAFPCRIMST